MLRSNLTGLALGSIPSRASVAAGAAAVLMALASSAGAQWSVTNLSPPAWNVSTVYSIKGGVPVGQVELGSWIQAGYWSGSLGSSWVSLNPAAAISSSATGSSANYQVGVSHVGGVYRASRWSGSAASWVDLSPAGATISYAWGMDGDNPVGSARIDGLSRASLWTAGPESWVDLGPAGALSSAAFNGGGGQQAGYVDFTGDWHAAVWSGSAASHVDLHPAGATSSFALGADGAQQVGIAHVAGENHASLWSGSAASWVDLHPAGFESSRAEDVWGGWQVGYVWDGVASHASLWNGTAESRIDLGDELGPWFTRSTAHSIWSDGATLYIGGSAHNSFTDGIDAIVWTRAIPAPGTLALLGVGGLLGGRRRRR